MADTIKYIRDEGVELRVLTNDASRSQLQQVQMFEDLGLKGLKENEIITSGMLARQFLELKIKEGKFAYLGTQNSANYIMKNGFDWHRDINRTINFLRRNNLPIIVANSDKYYPISRNDVAVAIGGISRLCESVLNQKFIRFGKPDSQMFMFAYDDINETGNFDKSDILMVGDTLHTDILGGNKFGLKTLLVLSGNTRSKTAELKINSSGIIPDYISDSILE